MSNEKIKTRVASVEFTRFVGAFSIVVFHFGTGAYPFSQPFLLKGFNSANLAVSYFIVLSGFVAAIGARNEVRKTKEFSAREYWLDKAVRVYPVCLLALVLVLFEQLMAHPQTVDLWAIVTNALLLQAWFPPYALSLNSPSWALSALLFFWAIAPFVIYPLENLSITRLLLVVFPVWIVSLLAHIVLLKFMYQGYPSYSHNFIFYNPLMHFNAFIVGISGGLIFGMVRDRLTACCSLWFVVLALFLIGGVATGLIPWVPGYSHNGLLSPVFAVFLIGLSADKSMIGRYLDRKVFEVLGGISFCIYVLQAPLHMYLYHVYRLLHFRHDSIAFWLFVICLVLLAYVVHVTVELPVKVALKRAVS